MPDTPVSTSGTTPDPPKPVWHVINGDDLLHMLRRVQSGETADLVYVEEFVNAGRETVEPDDR